MNAPASGPQLEWGIGGWRGEDAVAALTELGRIVGPAAAVRHAALRTIR